MEGSSMIKLEQLLSRGIKECKNCKTEFVGDSSKKFCKSCFNVLRKTGSLELNGGASKVRLVQRPRV